MVELFTSQGCSSCPPADAYLGTLAKRADIVALAFHVDYWDYIGWKDPFATRATTDRQRAYVRSLQQRYVYTPQMVVDGIGHDTGRERAGIDKLLGQAQRRSSGRATPELSRTAAGALTVTLGAFALEGQPADVTLAIYDRRHSTPVASGENQGRMLENFNTVRRLESLGRWNGAAASWTIDDARLQPGLGAAVIVQRADYGPVIGCNKLEPMVSG
ncbi:thioredoxin family protein [soil metagenome]